jgi:hypothetical protein
LLSGAIVVAVERIPGVVSRSPATAAPVRRSSSSTSSRKICAVLIDEAGRSIAIVVVPGGAVTCVLPSFRSWMNAKIDGALVAP